MQRVHWSEVRLFNIPPSLEMLNSSGEVRELNCLLKSESPRTNYAKTRLVTFDKDYVIYRLKYLFKPFVGVIEVEALLALAQSAIGG